MNYIPGLSLRASHDAEMEGIDGAEIGEFAYDFVERERDFIHSPERIEAVASSASSVQAPSEKV